MKRLTAGVILMVLVLGVPMLQLEPGSFWAVVSYAAPNKKAGLATALLGAVHAGLHGAAWGLIAGPGGAFIAGVSVGV